MSDDIDDIQDPRYNIIIAVGHSINLYVGLHGRGWLYVLRMPPRADVRL